MPLNAKDFNKAKSLCIVFPGGTGGNHLANMISLCPEFSPRFKSKHYERDLIQKYENIPTGSAILSPHSVTAHFSKFHGVEALYDAEQVNIMKTSSAINIIAGHTKCFTAAFIDNVSCYIKDPIWIVVPFPKQNTELYKRILKYKFVGQTAQDYDFPLNISYHYPIYDQNCLVFNSESFFKTTGSAYLRSFLFEKFNIFLPKSADKIHNIWMERILEVLNSDSLK